MDSKKSAHWRVAVSLQFGSAFTGLVVQSRALAQRRLDQITCETQLEAIAIDAPHQVDLQEKLVIGEPTTLRGDRNVDQGIGGEAVDGIEPNRTTHSRAKPRP